jgi:hypothetical protein
MAAAAQREGVAILERLPTLERTDQYNLACKYAQLAATATMPGSGLTPDQGQAWSERAMEWLRRAVAAGYRNVALMRTDPDLDSVRSRTDFQSLLMDLTIPDNPLAP